MENSNLAISKLIILAIVKQLPSITSTQLTNLALETLYMDYFTYIQAYQELCRDHLLLAAVRKEETELDASGKAVERCDITRTGETVLTTLNNQIPLHVKSYLLQITKTWRKSLRRRHDVQAAYKPDANGQYEVRLTQHDGVHELVLLKLTIPDQQMARQICEHWRQQPGSTYVSMLALLTGETAAALSGLNDQQPGQTVQQPEFTNEQDLTGQTPARPYKQEQRLL